MQTPSSTRGWSAPPADGPACDAHACDAVTGQAALTAFLEHLEHERRASKRTLEAYGACVRAYLAFLETHRGETPGLASRGEVTTADLRAYLAARRGGERTMGSKS